MKVLNAIELILGSIFLLGGATFSWYTFGSNIGIISVFGLVFVIAGLITMFDSLLRIMKSIQINRVKKRNKIRWEGEPVDKISLRARTSWVAVLITVIFLLVKQF